MQTTNNTTNTLLDINNLNMHFGGIKALTDVNIQIPNNEITAIIGPNGAGKTTLFNCITGFYTPTNGDMYLSFKNNSDNKDINRVRLNTLLGEGLRYLEFFNLTHLQSNLQKLYYLWFGGAHLLNRIGIARTFQNIRLFSNMSVIENLLVAQHMGINRNILSGLLNLKSYQDSEQQALDKAYTWLKICNIEKYANEIAGSLPYGHQRLLEIARAMCTNPKLICLDEPAAGLNANETENLCELITKLCTEYSTTVMLIEHDMNLIMNISSKIYVLDHGTVIARGTPHEIRNNPDVIAAYLGQ